MALIWKEGYFWFTFHISKSYITPINVILVWRMMMDNFFIVFHLFYHVKLHEYEIL